MTQRKNLIDNYARFDASIINESRFQEYIKMVLEEKGHSMTQEQKLMKMQEANYRFDQEKVREELGKM